MLQYNFKRHIVVDYTQNSKNILVPMFFMLAHLFTKKVYLVLRKKGEELGGI